MRFPAGCKSLDNLLDGGIEAGVITQVYGSPGSGKTQLCHTLSVVMRSNYRVIYIDSEGRFRPERIKEIIKYSHQLMELTTEWFHLEVMLCHVRVSIGSTRVFGCSGIILF